MDVISHGFFHLADAHGDGAAPRARDHVARRDFPPPLTVNQLRHQQEVGGGIAAGVESLRIPEEPPASARDILDTEMTMEDADAEDAENYAPDTFVHALGVCHRMAIFDADDDDDATPSRITAVISQLDIIRFLHRRADTLGGVQNASLARLGLAGESRQTRDAVVTAQWDRPAIECFKLMHDRRVSAVGVVDQAGELVANLSASDLRRVAFVFTLVPIRPRSRGARRSIRTFSTGASLRPGSLAFNPDTPRRPPFNSASDAFQLHPDVASYGPSTPRRLDAASFRLLALPVAEFISRRKGDAIGRRGAPFAEARRVDARAARAGYDSSSESDVTVASVARSRKKASLDADADAAEALLRDTRLNSSRTFVELIFARKETPLRRVLQLMATHDVHHVYVIDENDRPNAMITPTGAFCSLVPIRPRSRGERRSLRTLPGASLRAPHAFNPRHRRLSTPSDAFQLHLSTPPFNPTDVLRLFAVDDRESAWCEAWAPTYGGTEGVVA